MKKQRHDLSCIRNHLKTEGEYFLNGKGAINNWWKGIGSGLLDALDILNGDIKGDTTYFENCKCRKKRKLGSVTGKMPFTYYVKT